MIGTSGKRRIDLDALQARFALRVTSRLTAQAGDLPHDLSERLRVAREQAVARARELRRTETAPALSIQGYGGGVATIGNSPPTWVRLASLLPLMVLVLGLVLIQHLHDQAEIHAAADVDAALLADDLPPEAYGDPGFVEFLRQPEQ
jgi:hypothetical protein